MTTFGSSSGVITGINKLPFNPATPLKLFVDINSCFATVEQQYNPSLRGRPIAIAAYKGPGGCVIAPSIEAKELGIRTGMRVKEAQKICKTLIVMEPDSPKYRVTHKKIKKVLTSYTPKVTPKSIDEFAIDIAHTPAERKGAKATALAIKRDIREKVGEWITVSIGIAPNIFLAKMASELEKPDGLQKISKSNYLEVYKNLALTDLKGIKSGNASRLATQQIFSVLDFYHADIETLEAAFGSIAGYYWHLRIRGWEIDDVPQGEKKSFGNSYAVPYNKATHANLQPILYKLVQKTAARLRKNGYKARGFTLHISYRDGTSWKDKKTIQVYTNDTQKIYKIFLRLLNHCPYEKPVRILAETCFRVQKDANKQLELFTDTSTRDSLYEALDNINAKFGALTIKPAQLLKAKHFAPDRIGFGNIRELSVSPGSNCKKRLRDNSNVNSPNKPINNPNTI